MPDMSTMTDEELAEAGVPYFVDPEELRALGVDPEPYLRSHRVGIDEGAGVEMGYAAGYMLDRRKDAALIERLRQKREPHGTKQ
jgi:hypothetical protein